MSTVTSAPVNRSLGAYLRLTAAGFLVGAANLIPGVSGGTMALLLGIYEELLEAIHAVSNTRLFQALFRRDWRQLQALFPWQFLLAVGIGLGSAVLTLTHFLERLFATYPVHVEAFFFGLVAASVLIVGQKIRHWRAAPIMGLLGGAATAWILVDLAPARTPNTPWLLFISSAVAMGAMVLPGISGAFVLIMFGQYQYALTAVTGRELGSIALIGAGAVAGLVTFARLLSWLFKQQHDLTLGLLSGLVLGSLRKLWPWKESYLCAMGELLNQTNILPEAWTAEVTLAVLLAVAGFVLVLALGKEQHRTFDRAKTLTASR